MMVIYPHNESDMRISYFIVLVLHSLVLLLLFSGVSVLGGFQNRSSGESWFKAISTALEKGRKHLSTIMMSTFSTPLL